MTMAEHNAPEYAHWLLVATIILLVWAFLFGGVRVWAKVKAESDDCAVFGADRPLFQITSNMSWSHGDSIFAAAFVSVD